jgi:hypothetical protein
VASKSLFAVLPEVIGAVNKNLIVKGLCSKVFF